MLPDSQGMLGAGSIYLMLAVTLRGRLHYLLLQIGNLKHGIVNQVPKTVL